MADNAIDTTPRVNFARIPDYVGKHVRLIAKVKRFEGNEAIVETSDDGELKVILPPGKNLMGSIYVEFIGLVQSDGTLKMQKSYDIGNELDMAMANFVVEKWHDPRFAGRLF